MFFLCFSGQDRLTIVQSILYHFQKFGIKIWYDNHEYILGDNKVDKYTLGIEESKYAVIVFSPAFPQSPGALEELDVIKKRFDAGCIHVFPIFYNLLAKDVPQQFSWLCDLIYNEVNDATGTLLTCNQMVCKFYEDLLKNVAIKSLSDIMNHGSYLPSYCYKLVESYCETVPSNFNGRIALLFALFTYFEAALPMPEYLAKTTQYMFLNTKLDLTYNFKEITLMEQAVCLAANHYIRNSQ